MEAFTEVLNGLVNHPTACMLTLSLIVNGFLFRMLIQNAKEYIESILKQEKEHRDTLTKVIPAAEKLTESVVILERIIAHKD